MWINVKHKPQTISKEITPPCSHDFVEKKLSPTNATPLEVSPLPKTETRSSHCLCTRTVTLSWDARRTLPKAGAGPQRGLRSPTARAPVAARWLPVPGVSSLWSHPRLLLYGTEETTQQSLQRQLCCSYLPQRPGRQLFALTTGCESELTENVLICMSSEWFIAKHIVNYMQFTV